MKLKDSGITLIALVITIIILLILAGVTIGQLAGNGLFDKVKLAKEKSEEAQAKENETLGDYENKINEYIIGNREQILVDKDEYNQLKKLESGILNLSSANVIYNNDNLTWADNKWTSTVDGYIIICINALNTTACDNTAILFVNDLEISTVAKTSKIWSNHTFISSTYIVKVKKGDVLTMSPKGNAGMMNIKIIN